VFEICVFNVLCISIVCLCVMFYVSLMCAFVFYVSNLLCVCVCVKSKAEWKMEWKGLKDLPKT